jgi:hypothetical protein
VTRPAALAPLDVTSISIRGRQRRRLRATTLAGVLVSNDATSARFGTAWPSTLSTSRLASHRPRAGPGAPAGRDDAGDACSSRGQPPFLTLLTLAPPQSSVRHTRSGAPRARTEPHRNLVAPGFLSMTREVHPTELCPKLCPPQVKKRVKSYEQGGR